MQIMLHCRARVPFFKLTAMIVLWPCIELAFEPSSWPAHSHPQPIHVSAPGPSMSSMSSTRLPSRVPLRRPRVARDAYSGNIDTTTASSSPSVGSPGPLRLSHPLRLCRARGTYAACPCPNVIQLLEPGGRQRPLTAPNHVSPTPAGGLTATINVRGAPSAASEYRFGTLTGI